MSKLGAAIEETLMVAGFLSFWAMFICVCVQMALN